MLNAREVLFVQFMLSLNNGTKAAIAAGYAEAGAHVQASRMLQRPKIREALAAASKQICEDLNISPERTLAELASVAYAPLKGMTDSGRSTKVKALDHLMRHLGQYREDNSQKGELSDLVAALQAGRDRVRGRA